MAKVIESPSDGRRNLFQILFGFPIHRVNLHTQAGEIGDRLFTEGGFLLRRIDDGFQSTHVLHRRIACGTIIRHYSREFTHGTGDIDGTCAQSGYHVGARAQRVVHLTAGRIKTFGGLAHLVGARLHALQIAFGLST